MVFVLCTLHLEQRTKYQVLNTNDEQPMCPVKIRILLIDLLCVVARTPQTARTCEDVLPQFLSKVCTKKLNRVHCWSTLSPTNRRDASFSACVCKKRNRAFAPQPGG